MDASMITSLGTCKLVIPRSELTMARSAFSDNAFSISASMGFRSLSGSFFSLLYRLSSPSFALMPNVSKVVLYFSKTSLKYTFMICPNMMGSETFIMVAFKWTDSKIPSSFASLTCCFKKATSALFLMTVASIISSCCRATFSLSRVFEPSSDTKAIFTVVADGVVNDFSLCLKSPFDIVATCVFEFEDHSPMVCGFFFA